MKAILDSTVIKITHKSCSAPQLAERLSSLPRMRLAVCFVRAPLSTRVANFPSKKQEEARRSKKKQEEAIMATPARSLGRRRDSTWLAASSFDIPGRPSAADCTRPVSSTPRFACSRRLGHGVATVNALLGTPWLL